jgi:acetyl-CoA synthetase
VTGTEIAWRPDAATSAASNLAAFMRSLGVASYEDLLERADREPEWFFNALLKHIDYRFYRPYERVLDDSRGAPWRRWCIGGTTNVVLNALDRWRDTPTWNKPALIWEGEDGAKAEYSYRELDAAVCRTAGALRSLGLGRGDVIALYMPNVPEAMITLLATTKIGAIAMPLFSGFGADAMLARLQLGRAKALVTVDGTLRRGKPVDAKVIVDEALAQAPHVESVIVLRRAGNPIAMKPGRDHWWHEIVPQQPDSAPTEQMPAGRAVPAGIYFGHDGKAEGRRAWTRGLPCKAHHGPVAADGLQGKRPDALDVGHGLGRRPADRLYDAAHRRHGRPRRRGAERAGSGPDVAARRGARRHVPRCCPDDDPHVHGARQRAVEVATTSRGCA